MHLPGHITDKFLANLWKHILLDGRFPIVSYCFSQKFFVVQVKRRWNIALVFCYTLPMYNEMQLIFFSNWWSAPKVAIGWTCSPLMRFVSQVGRCFCVPEVGLLCFLPASQVRRRKASKAARITEPPPNLYVDGLKNFI